MNQDKPPSVQEAINRVRVWVDDIKKANADKRLADAHKNAQSLERAADLEVIYNDKNWVKDLPPVKRKRIGRRIDPKSRERFSMWVRQQYGWGSSGYLTQLHEANDLAPILLARARGIGHLAPGPAQDLENYARYTNQLTNKGKEQT